VNYTGLVVPTVPFTHPDNAPLTLALSMMTLKVLHREIRQALALCKPNAAASIHPPPRPFLRWRRLTQTMMPPMLGKRVAPMEAARA
jgi:hypothetical protein